MSNLKLFFISLPPAVGIAVISFYFLPLLWSVVSVALAILLLVILFVATGGFVGTRARQTELGAAGGIPDSEVSESELRLIFNTLGDALLIYDEDFRILFFNAAAERLFMMSEKEVSGARMQPENINDPKLKLLAEVIFPSLAPVMVPRSQAGAWPQIVDLSFDEPQLELRVMTSQLGQAPGQPARFLKIIQNRTHETALLKTKSDFVTVASHQFKTPLTHINWALDALKSDPALGEGNKEMINEASKAGHLLAEIVENLLSISKMEEGRFGYKFEPADPVEFLDKVLGQVLPEANRAGVRLYFEKPPSSLPEVFIDKQRLALALTNFLDNAVRYNTKNGEVIVRVAQLADKPFLQFSIKDTGIGIPGEDIPKLFGKFFRAENAVKFQTEGTGLGLYIAKNIIEAHGGKVRIESELNRGTTLYFTLPTDKSLVPQREMPIE